MCVWFLYCTPISCVSRSTLTFIICLRRSLNLCGADLSLNTYMVRRYYVLMVFSPSRLSSTSFVSLSFMVLFRSLSPSFVQRSVTLGLSWMSFSFFRPVNLPHAYGAPQSLSFSFWMMFLSFFATLITFLTRFIETAGDDESAYFGKGSAARRRLFRT